MTPPGKFYLTTSIFYANAVAHLGHAYESLACDTIARWRRIRGDDTFFLTGLDEHGGNIEKVAKEQGIAPQEWCDRIAIEDTRLFKDLLISHDDLIRTTEARHAVATEAFWKIVAAGSAPDGKPNIYKGEYEGLYCSPCEAFYVESDLIEGNCPIHKSPVEAIKEETYFFHLSGYQSLLDEFFAVEEGKAPEDRFVVPETRFNEVRGMLKEGLRDISISRTKIGWGFPVPGDSKHVIYVWFDALINYLTAIGYPDLKAARWAHWPADMHVIGKDITRFHALLWPAMLKAAGLPWPRKIVSHGWWTVEGKKISKSTGNVIDPRDYTAKYSVDALRHFLLAEISFGADGDFSERRFIERYNADLANVFGNLCHRTISMSFRYLQGNVPAPKSPSPWDGLLNLPAKVDSALRIPQFQSAIESIHEFAKRGNKYLDEKAPWNQPEVERTETLGHVLVLLEALSWELLPFLPEKAVQLRAQLGFPADHRTVLPVAFTLTQGDPLFPRVDTKKKS